MEIIFFNSAQAFSDWLEENHLNKNEVYVGFYKVGTGKPSLTWSQSVDVALCFGWIDGVKKSIDSESYMQRFTPRRESSNWSAINLKKVELLMSQGLMRPAGIEIYTKRNPEKCEDNNFEKPELVLDEKLDLAFQKNNKAWEFFQKQPPSYRKTCIQWIMSAKQEPTRATRLEKLIAYSGNGQRLA